MKFGDIPLDEAEGAVLGHSVKVGKHKTAKGRVLDADDLDRFRAAGLERIVGARLEHSDVPEAIAAGAIGRGLRHDSLRVADASTGRVNVFARFDGLCLLDVDAIHEINAVCEDITIATLPPYRMVYEDELVATIKIIPFAAAEVNLSRVSQIIGDSGAPIRVQAFQPRTVGVVFSELPTVKFSALEKTIRVLEARLQRLGETIGEKAVCRHDAANVAETMQAQLKSYCDLLLLFGASAIVDRGDAIPQAIVEAGGEVTYFGMPVEPGNMLLLGRVDEVDVVGLPGCARSPALNGFDWVLQRLFARLPVSGAEIASMGVGGLLKEPPRRVRQRRSLSGDTCCRGPALF